DDVIKTISHYKELLGEYLLIDGYKFQGQYQRKIKEYNIKLVLIDDHHYSDLYCCDLIINKSILAENLRYKVIDSSPKFLLGPKYTTLRREFLNYKQIRKHSLIPANILVSFGGSDPNNVTYKVVKLLANIIISNSKVNIIIGPAYKYRKQLEKYVESLGNQFIIQFNVGNMADLMKKADFAITAGGTTLYELAYMGLPSISLQIVDNQKSAKFFDEQCKTTMYLGSIENLKNSELYSFLNSMNSYEYRERMGRNCFKLIDGLGNTRVIEQILKL